MSNVTSESSMESTSPPPLVRRVHAPCAVCEDLRRRCRRDCPFARHFPGERPTCLDSLCLLYGTQQARRMLEVLSEERWIPAANSLVHRALHRLRERENEAFEIISRLQNQVIDLQVSNSFLRNQIDAGQWPQQRLLGLYDLIEWPTNDGQAGVNEPDGGQTGEPPASGPGEGSMPPGGQDGAPGSSEEDNHSRTGPP